MAELVNNFSGFLHKKTEVTGSNPASANPFQLFTNAEFFQSQVAPDNNWINNNWVNAAKT